jgi:hypothetical protein
MKFEIPKTVRFLDFREYDPENAALAGVGIHVWVDPPRSALLELDRLNGSYLAEMKRYGGTLGPAGAKKPGLGMLFRKAREQGAFRSFVDSYHRSVYAWYARIWSQAADPETHWTVAEVQQVDEANTVLLEWMYRKTFELIEQHRADTKKGSRPPLQGSPETEKPAT